MFRRLGSTCLRHLADVRERTPPPGEYGTARYIRHQQTVVRRALKRPHIARQPGYGEGFDERVVELPWVLAAAPFGRLLDAGSALNHRHVLPRFAAQADEITIATLTPEPVSFPNRARYVYADLRDLPFADGSFDTVVSVSTLEHVGKDTRPFGGSDPGQPGLAVEAFDQALSELLRVTAPTGRLLVTLPYGAREDGGFFWQPTREDIERLRPRSVAVFRHGSHGWAPSTLADAAQDEFNHSARPTADNRAPRARAVVCLAITHQASAR